MDAPISDEELLEMAGDIAPVYYLKLGVKLGLQLARLEQILQSKNSDYLRSTVAILMMWMGVPGQGESWRTKRIRLAEIFSSVGIKTLSDVLLSVPQSSQPAATAPQGNVSILEPVTGLTDAVFKEIADNLETDDQMESLARALGQTRTQINQCHTSNRLTGSVTTRGTVEMLTAWKATVHPENQMSSMRNAMTSARLIYLRDTILVKAEKQLEQKRQDYQKHLQRQEHQEHCQHQSSLDSLSSMKTSEVDHAFSSLHSVDIRTSSFTEIQMDARRTVESKQRSASPCQPSNTSPTGSNQIQQKYYDIYLVFSQETEHVRKLKDIIQRNNWEVMTAMDSRLGVPKMKSIQDALKTCSHVVLIITKEDCEKSDLHQTMTTEMAFQSRFIGSLEGGVISIRCCDESCLPLELQSLTNACISDACLEERLKRSIDVSIRKRRKERFSSGSDDSSHLNPSSTQVVTSPGSDTSKRMTNSTKTGNNPTLPTEGATSIAPLATFDTSIQPLTAAQVASQIEQLIPRMNELQAGPSCLLNIQGNVYNIGSMQCTGRPDDVSQHPMVIPPAVRHELSKRLNGSRVTHDDWRGLACKFGLDGYIDSLNQRPDPTSDVIGLAEKQKKLCSLEDLRGILVRMKRDDCVEALDALDQNGGTSGELMNRLMIRDRDSESSSSDDF